MIDWNDHYDLTLIPVHYLDLELKGQGSIVETAITHEEVRTQSLHRIGGIRQLLGYQGLLYAKMSRPYVNPDLQKERDGAKFDRELLTYELYGGEERTKRRRAIGDLSFSIHP